MEIENGVDKKNFQLNLELELGSNNFDNKKSRTWKLSLTTDSTGFCMLNQIWKIGLART